MFNCPRRMSYFKDDVLESTQQQSVVERNMLHDGWSKSNATSPPNLIIVPKSSMILVGLSTAGTGNTGSALSAGFMQSAGFIYSAGLSGTLGSKLWGGVMWSCFSVASF